MVIFTTHTIEEREKEMRKPLPMCCLTILNKRAKLKVLKKRIVLNELKKQKYLGH